MNEEVLKSLLKQVKYPGFSKDVLAFGLIQNVKITGNDVALGVKFSTEQEAVRQEILANIERVLREGGAGKINIEIIQTQT